MATVCEADFHYYPEGGSTLEDIAVVSCGVRNGREADLPGWQHCGFELMNLPSSVTDWQDDDQVANIHYTEMRRWACELTGADHALVSGHIRRDPEHAAQHEDYAPIQFVHSDFADTYGDRLRHFYGATDNAEAQSALAAAGIDAEVVANARRILILQTWRNLGPAKMDLPIAFCDARCVPRKEIMAFNVPNYADSGDPFDTLAILRPKAPDAHHWYTFPHMQPDEAVVFRTFDSERIGSEQPYWTPHSAFRDPEVQLGAPARRSIELRATCLFI